MLDELAVIRAREIACLDRVLRLQTRCEPYQLEKENADGQGEPFDAAEVGTGRARMLQLVAEATERLLDLSCEPGGALTENDPGEEQYHG